MKRIFTFLTLILIVGIAFGKQIDEATARKVGQHFLNARTNSTKLMNITNLEIIYKSGSKAFNPLSAIQSSTYFYVFNAGSVGFVIVSGDDNVTPILGYSDQGTFDPTNIPRNTSKWLEEYKNQIRYVIENKIPATEKIAQEWVGLTDENTSGGSLKRASVSPLMATTWNQSPYYNANCPNNSVTGCVATAMAQIMKYWNYPTTGTGFHSYNHANYGTLSANFGSTTYQWSSMANNVTSANSAVATLMYQVGVSVDMDYSPQVSGAYVITAKSPVTHCSEYALKTYFGYASVSGVERANYTDANWLALLKTELNATRPILYAGFGSGGGHCFVADGFDNNDYIHFNWGWGGAYDGYFHINALNPSGTGTGGGSGGFNSGHQAVINIKPPAGGGSKDYKIALYNYVSNSASTIYYGQAFTTTTNFINKGTGTYNGDYAAVIFDKDYKFVEFMEIKTGYTLQANYKYNTDLVFSAPTGKLSMLPGTYYIGMFYRPTGGDWLQVEDNGSYTNLEQINVINPNDIELYANMSVTPTKLTQGKPVSVTLNIINTGSSTFTGQYSVDLYDLEGKYVENIGTVDETAGLPSNYAYVSPFLTFTSNSITAKPGSYYLAIEHKSTGGNWELTGSSNYQNPIKVTVMEPPLLPDQYEVNNSAQTAYTFPVTFTGSSSAISTTGSNLHIETDADYYKIVLPPGYDYSIAPRLHDSYNSGNGNTYSIDALFSFSSNGTSWSDAYDNVLPGTLSVPNGGTVYFQIAPNFAGETGSYLFDINTTRAPLGSGIQSTIANLIKVYPNPAKEIINIDLNAYNGEVSQINLVNIQGQNVITMLHNSPEKSLTIPLTNLSDGVYFMQIATESGILTKKIVIVK